MTISLALDEKLLLEHLRQDDEQAFEVLYHRYKGLLYVHALKKLDDRDEVMDIIQEIFAALWEKRHHLHIATSISAYLYQAVRYKVIDRLNKSQSAKRYLDSLEDFAKDYQWADYRVRERMLRDLIEQEIADLPPKMRQVFDLSRKEGLSHKEIADLLGISEQGVRSHIKHALRLLRVKMGVYLLLVAMMEF